MVKTVAIVGAGPSGLLLAHYLLRRHEKYQIDIFDFRHDPRTINFSKSRTFPIVLSQRGINALRQIEGLEEAVKAISLENTGGMLHQKNGKTRIFNRRYTQWSLDRTSLVIKLLEQLSISSDRINIHFNHQCTNVLLISDAAHAVSPSLGQGCNAALEDVVIFNQILDEYADNLAVAVEQFTIQRQADGLALVKLSDYSFPASKKLFFELLLRNRLSKYFHPILPKFFLPPLFELVGEGKLSYSEILNLYPDWIAKVKKSNQEILSP